jgi:hypothetical protein
MQFALALVLATLGALGCRGEQVRRGDPLPASELMPYQRCEVDQDCMWATNGCCDCANGGTEVAIARAQEAAFRARFDCENLPCTTMGRRPPCGTGKVACESERCVFRAASR